MKKVVNGILFNTETAEKVCDYSNYLSRSDFRYMNFSVFRTKKGRFFIFGEGGPMTMFAESVGNNSYIGSSDKIIPISENEARYYAEKSGLEADEITRFFKVVEA